MIHHLNRKHVLIWRPLTDQPPGVNDHSTFIKGKHTLINMIVRKHWTRPYHGNAGNFTLKYSKKHENIHKYDWRPVGRQDSKPKLTNSEAGSHLLKRAKEYKICRATWDIIIAFF